MTAADQKALVMKIQTLLAEQGYDPGPRRRGRGAEDARGGARLPGERSASPAPGVIDRSLVAALAEPHRLRLRRRRRRARRLRVDSEAECARFIDRSLRATGPRVRQPDLDWRPAVLIYLPIAELSVNMFIIFGMGGAVGFLSGLFGVGGGFLLTPLLIFSGIPPVVSVATVASQIVASSASAALSYWRRRMIDLKLAAVLMLSGVVGTLLGVVVFNGLRSLGQLDLIIGISYVTFLGTIGGLMLSESVRAIAQHAARQAGAAPPARPAQLDPRAAAQDAVQALEALCQRHSGGRASASASASSARCSASAAASSWCRR